MKILLLGALLLINATGLVSATENESAYTKIDLAKCEPFGSATTGDDDTGDSYFGECKGYRDYPIYFKEGDLRQSLHFGRLEDKVILETYETFGPFNHMTNNTVEWRLDGKKIPYAAILRFSVVNTNEAVSPADNAREGQMLVVYKVGRDEDKVGCVIGYIDALANKTANDLARELADKKALSFACGKDKPSAVGTRGPLSAEMMSSFPSADK